MIFSKAEILAFLYCLIDNSGNIYISVNTFVNNTDFKADNDFIFYEYLL